MNPTLKTFILWTLGLCACLPLAGQSIYIHAQKQSLGSVMNILNRQYALQYSAAESLLNDCEISLQATFSSPERAVDALTSACGLAYEQVGEVFVILAKAPNLVPSLQFYEGYTVDRETGEGIPYVIVHTESACVISDNTGRFQLASPQSSLSVRFRHLAYGEIDTLLFPSEYLMIALSPEDYCLEEVPIHQANPLSHSPQFGPFPIEHALKHGGLNPGVFRSWEEMRNNRPSSPWQAEIVSRMRPVDGRDSVLEYYFDLRRQDARQVGPTFAYSDGDQLYLNADHRHTTDRRPKMRKHSTFVPVTLIGPYLYFNQIEEVMSDALCYTSTQSMIWHLQSGQAYRLTPRRIRTILADQPALLQQFKAESFRAKRNRATLRHYLERYFETRNALRPSEPLR